MRPDQLERRLWGRLDALGPAPGAELLIDCEEDRTLRAVLAGMLREMDRHQAMEATYLAALMFPSWLPEDPIASFRRRYDPTAHLEPHITLIFPIPTWELGRRAFTDHVRTVVSATAPFDIRLNGLEKSWDHWLFLVPTEGRDQIIELHDELYTGPLRPFLWTEQPYVPHIGLGLFADTSDEQDLHDLLTRRGRLDPARFDRGLREAKALDLDHTGPFESVYIVELPDLPTYVNRIEEVRMQGRQRTPPKAQEGSA